MRYAGLHKDQHTRYVHSIMVVKDQALCNTQWVEVVTITSYNNHTQDMYNHTKQYKSSTECKTPSNLYIPHYPRVIIRARIFIVTRINVRVLHVQITCEVLTM